MQIFIRLCNNQLLSYYDENNDNTIGEIKKYIFKRTKIPSTWQRFVMGSKPFYENSLKYKEIPLHKDSTLNMYLKWHGVGCNCKSCLNKGMLLRNGKRLNFNNL